MKHRHQELWRRYMYRYDDRWELHMSEYTNVHLELCVKVETIMCLPPLSSTTFYTAQQNIKPGLSARSCEDRYHVQRVHKILYGFRYAIELKAH